MSWVLITKANFVAIRMRQRIRRVQVRVFRDANAEPFNQFATKPTAEKRRTDADKRQRISAECVLNYRATHFSRVYGTNPADFVLEPYR